MHVHAAPWKHAVVRASRARSWSVSAHSDQRHRTHYSQEARITAFLPMLHGKLENYTLSTVSGKSAQVRTLTSLGALGRQR